MPQTPGPLISLAGVTNSVVSTSRLALQAYSVWSRQGSRCSNLLRAQPVRPAPNNAKPENANTLRHMMRTMRSVA